MLQKLLKIFSLLAMCSCASLERSNQSGYSSSNRTGSKLTKRSSLVQSRNFADDKPIDYSLKSRLKQLENGLISRKDLDQYSRALPLFHDESERTEFLEVVGYEDRQKWLAEKKLASRSQSIQSQYSEIVESQDVAVGMPNNLVRKAWGEPEAIDVSGNPSFKNERWRYRRYVSTPEGYKQEKKIVYFEGGRVVGWESE